LKKKTWSQSGPPVSIRLFDYQYCLIKNLVI